MADKENAPQEVVDELMTDPDRDAERRSPPKPPQTVANEPEGEASR